MTNQEINEAVARKLGWTKHSFHIVNPTTKAEKEIPGIPYPIRKGWTRNGEDFFDDVPDYYHSIEAAWEIVQSLKDKYVTIEKGVLSPYMCSINWAEGEQTDFVITEHADTAPMAICLAFLKLEDVRK